MERCGTLILGAGAAGLFAAGTLVQGGARDVLLLEQGRAPGEKIRISGGGRCNFTNLATAPDRFLSQHPRFAASALARFRPADFVALVDAAGIAWHEKTAGQLFCDGPATQIVQMLLARAAGVPLRTGVTVHGLDRDGAGFVARTSGGPVAAERVILAAGGKPAPKMGASGIALEIAAGFGLPLVPERPGLVPFTLDPPPADLAGVATPARVRAARGPAFEDALLHTHRGLSGPAILQASSFWLPGETVAVDFAPGADLAATLRAARRETPKRAPATVLGQHLPDRLAQRLAEGLPPRAGDLSNAAIDALAARIHRGEVRPQGTEGWRTAEVMVGGIATDALDGRTMEARAVPGLYAVGEAVDVTGWLGGYNFQWAWASGGAAARAILEAGAAAR